MDGHSHIGVAEDDPRNDAVIAFFRPKDVTAAYVRQRLAAVSPRAPGVEIAEKAKRFIADTAKKTPAPPPPLSQPVESARDPGFGLGVHPDIIEQLWELDRSLAEPCRWLVWGHPALVHPKSGVIFAVAIGTIGVVLRLPPDLRTPKANLRRFHGSGPDYDISPAGPEWRFWDSGADPLWATRAFAYAS